MPSAVDALRSVVGAEHVLTEPSLTASYTTDWTRRWSGSALCVVRPASTREVTSVVRTCAAEGVAIVPQGGNTGLVGGGVPRGGEVVVSTARLTGIEPAPGMSLVAGAGVTLAAVHDAARAGDAAFGVDFASRDSATVGGMIATNAGGIHVVRHGSTLSQVLGVEAVLADGSVVGRVPALRKDNTGYPLSALLTGSEGTLAVITHAHLRLVARAPERVVALSAVGTIDDAVALAEVATTHLAPVLSAIELIDATTLRLVCDHAGVAAPLPGAPAATVLVECVGASRPDDELSAFLDAAGTMVGATAVSTDEPTCARLWAYRERATEAISARGVPHKFDVTIPAPRLAAFCRAVHETITAVVPSSSTYLFGHLGDGNVHVNVVDSVRIAEATGVRLDAAVYSCVAEHDGSISAEHGIGVAKVPYLALTRTSEEIAAMRMIKTALDPDGILNPGVLLPVPRESHGG